MIYSAKTQRGILGWILLLMIATILINDFSNWLFYFQLVFSLVILGLLFIKFTFVINEDYLTYQVLFFNLPLYKKRIYHNQTIQIKFKRVSWYSKGAIIQVKKGFNIRIVNFAPNDVFKNLLDFAIKNGISYSKTRDYLILEK